MRRLGILPHRSAPSCGRARTIAPSRARPPAQRAPTSPASGPSHAEDKPCIERRGSVVDQTHWPADPCPDGRRACAAVTTYDMDRNEGRTELWLFATDGGKARRLTAGDKDSEPCWSPDGKWIAFAAKRKDDEEPQVYLIAPDGGEARRLAALAGGAMGLRWFPDSKRVAFISWVWPDLQDRPGAGQAAEGAQGGKGQSAPVRAPRNTGSGTIGSRTDASRTSSPRRWRPAARATCWRGPVLRCSLGNPRPSSTISVPTAGSWR